MMYVDVPGYGDKRNSEPVISTAVRVKLPAQNACLPRAAASASDVLWINGGYGAAYFAVMVLLGKRLNGEWIYPVLDDLEKGFGPAGPYLLAAAIIAISLLLGLADRSLAAGAA